MPSRPLPPDGLRRVGDLFVPAPELLAFLREAFIREGAPFGRPEYEHLREARIGTLWTNVERIKGEHLTLGTAQLFRDVGDRWTVGRTLQQLREWFGDWWDDDADDDPYPHFIITIYAPAAAEMNDPSFAALCAHELRHCGQKRDRWGEPKFDRDGNPEWTIVGHDVEEFVSVVEDFGIEAAGPAAVRFVEAARKAPRFSAVDVAGVCGCGAKIQLVA